MGVGVAVVGDCGTAASRVGEEESRGSGISEVGDFMLMVTLAGEWKLVAGEVTEVAAVTAATAEAAEAASMDKIS
jgi:hypothetical protein